MSRKFLRTECYFDTAGGGKGKQGHPFSSDAPFQSAFSRQKRYSPSFSFAQARMRCFWILPAAFMGKRSTNSM